MRSSGLPAVLVASLLLAGACGVPTNETAQAIDPEQLPESLRPDFTTTTTTSEPAPLTESATVFLLWLPPDTERRVVVEVSREVPLGSSLETVLSTLFGSDVRTEQEVEEGYSSALFELDLGEVSIDDGVATIDVIPLTPEGEPSEEPFTGDLLGAAAQLVWTATEYEGVMGARILINGEGVIVPTTNQDAEPGQILTRVDYERFDPERQDAITTTTTTTTAPSGDEAPA
jgi:spore germination protein GerM